MFWPKTEKISWTLVMFGLIALGVIGSVSILIILLVQNVGPSNIEGAVMGIGPALVEKNYELGLEDLRQKVTTETEKEMFSLVEEAMFSLRVPAAKRGAHLQALIAMLALKESVEENKKEKVLEILGSL